MWSRLPMFVAMLVTLPVFATDIVVETPAGKLRGLISDDLNVFKGIAYALPPIGANRWKPPVPIPAWKGVRDATQFGAACVQPKPRAGSIYADEPPVMSEDCLFLNIWSPKSARKAPVFVWIHGGALSAGASNLSMYEGSKLASRDVVFVSINYRLGILGYLAHPELSAESPQKISGNYGLKDQIEALKDYERSLTRQPAVARNPAARAALDRIRDQIQQMESRLHRSGGPPPPVPAGFSMALGSAYFRLNQLTDAEREYRAAIEVDSTFGEAHNNLAVVYLITGRPVEADASLKAAEQAGFKVNPRLKADIAAAVAKKRGS